MKTSRSHSLHKYRHRLGKTVKAGVVGYFSEYETPKLVLIHSFTFAVLLRIMQIIILVYSVLYLLLYEKGYQKQDTAIISSVTLKVKGIGYVFTEQNKTIVTDVADYIIPPSENSAIFIMTNFVQFDQTRSVCPESLTLTEALCTQDYDCQNKPSSPKVNGLWTGRCLFLSDTYILNGTINVTRRQTGVCEYTGWCPAEDDLAPEMLVKNVLNFTLFIKNFIEFPAFDVRHKNMVDELTTCKFHPKDDKDCPIFSLEYILNQTETDLEERKLMLRWGGVIRVKLDWDCNLDRNIKLCKPEYSFARLDVPFRDNPFSRGFNFRYASNWKNAGINFRTLVKAYGLRLIISVNGKAGKFDFITLSLNTGSLVGIFGLATFLCDIFLLHISRGANQYRNHVFETVHLRTRVDSTSHNSKDRIHNDDQYLNSESQEDPESTIKSPGKTVVTRPLTLMNTEQMKYSGKI